MSEQVDISINAMAERSGVTPAAFRRRDWHLMTRNEQIADCDEWIGDVDVRIRKDMNFRTAMLTNKVALQQAGGK